MTELEVLNKIFTTLQVTNAVLICMLFSNLVRKRWSKWKQS